MLNEAPKKRKKREADDSDPSALRLFRRTQWECFRRAVTPYLMYLFMSLLCLVCQLIGSLAARVALGILCIAGGAFYNANLCYNYGKMHYGAYVAGELHRKSVAEGIASGGDHRPEREYRPWKGFLIGLYVALPAILLGIVAGAIPEKYVMTGGGVAYYALVMFAGWAIIPISWFGTKKGADGAPLGLRVSPYFSILMCILPILVSGIAYLVGAARERDDRLKNAEKTEIERGGKKKKAKK